jgi:hypothetical protein
MDLPLPAPKFNPVRAPRLCVLLPALASSLAAAHAHAVPSASTTAGANDPPFSTPWLFASTASQSRFAVAGSTATWTPAHPDTVVTYLPPHSLKSPGDTVSLAWQWASNGTDECPASTWGLRGCVANKCSTTDAYKSVHCVGGTGDFRIFVGDTATSPPLNGSGFCDTDSYGPMEACLSKPPFSQWRGYNFRIFPHVSSEAEHFPTAVPCGFYKKRSDFIYDSTRIAEDGCFQLPTGVFGTLKLTLTRSGGSEISLAMDMNGHEFAAKDSDGAGQPDSVDVIAIQFPNGRPYSFVKWMGGSVSG